MHKKKIFTSILIAIFCMGLLSIPVGSTVIQNSSESPSTTLYGTEETTFIEESTTEVETTCAPETTTAVETTTKVVETTTKPRKKPVKKKVEQTTKPSTTKQANQKQGNQKQNVTKKNFGVFKSYTDYRCLSRSSAQWKLQEKAYTDGNGLRKIGDAYLVALGSYYGTQLGTRYTVSLSNGNVFDIILCDCKQDRHTDSLHRECLGNGSVLEFYVEKEKMPASVRRAGSVSAIPFFSGAVESIERA